MELWLPADFPYNVFKNEGCFFVDGLLSLWLLFDDTLVDWRQVCEGQKTLLLALDSNLRQIAPISVPTVALDSTVLCHAFLGPADNGECLGSTPSTLLSPLLDSTALHGWLNAELFLHRHCRLQDVDVKELAEELIDELNADSFRFTDVGYGSCRDRVVIHWNFLLHFQEAVRDRVVRLFLDLLIDLF